LGRTIRVGQGLLAHATEGAKTEAKELSEEILPFLSFIAKLRRLAARRAERKGSKKRHPSAEKGSEKKKKKAKKNGRSQKRTVYAALRSQDHRPPPRHHRRYKTKRAQLKSLNRGELRAGKREVRVSKVCDPDKKLLAV